MLHLKFSYGRHVGNIVTINCEAQTWSATNNNVYSLLFQFTYNLKSSSSRQHQKRRKLLVV